jgi:hypothetical protein
MSAMSPDPLLRFERAFEAIDEIRATGAWEGWRGQPALVT